MLVHTSICLRICRGLEAFSWRWMNYPDSPYVRKHKRKTYLEFGHFGIWVSSRKHTSFFFHRDTGDTFSVDWLTGYCLLGGLSFCWILRKTEQPDPPPPGLGSPPLENFFPLVKVEMRFYIHFWLGLFQKNPKNGENGHL